MQVLCLYIIPLTAVALALMLIGVEPNSPADETYYPDPAGLADWLCFLYPEKEK